MAVPTISPIRLNDADVSLPTLVLGPSLGSTTASLWHLVAPHLAPHFRLVAWDLPGHGEAAVPVESFSLAELAAGVKAMADETIAGPVHYAGVSIGGAVGVQLGHDYPEAFASLSILCSAAKIGTPETWHERADLVRRQGTEVLEEGSKQRWFGPGFVDAHPGRAAGVIDSLRATDAGAYAFACEALADYDLRASLAAITAPLLAVAGEHDAVCPPAAAEELAGGVRDGRSAVVPGAAHLAPLEAPETVAGLMARHVLG
ncbi:alpha/beta fold hydrolase [Zhihengliuella salsuginis]|uniref:AB hydrolase-1 domain-containing protein n=1 Tax=Zhihengliuella salsuginis TaxID=578222 RepID=A0ABQ3GKC3_9MICC|nr:alpha/beta fold hydrolase [Zhihengliuella salsuginis]GHD06691.1 hypothetical protein GCM10008096_16950 [Zhihengliuella salsuginis]